MSQENLRDEFRNTLNHIGDVLSKITAQAVPHGTLSESDLYTLAEGLFLFAFTHWEQFTRNLLIEDLATNPTSKLHTEVKQFSDPEAAKRLAVRLLNHPDHPRKFIEWSDYGDIVSRANEFLGAGNRFAATPLPRRNDLELLKRVRNAVAHRSDKAWTSFLNLCEDVPFSIPPAQVVGITPGRFLIAHTWYGQPILRDTIVLLDAAACHLVP
jgi:hypothetical protein